MMPLKLKQFEHLKIQLEAIRLATNNFADDNCIGKGGFGKVYKGELLHSKGQTMVAMKRLDRMFGQGNQEFWKEIIMLSVYKHKNIVSLLGFCDESNEKILIYEYASKGSLDFYLDNHDLTWVQRLRICIGAARGLAFLHNPGGTQQRVLHRDIKSSNILLDDNWDARISDLGLSKFGPANQKYTFLVSHTVGTIGYCDPQYVETGLLTKESDVYSFGVVLFEILCGRLCFGNNDDKHRPFTVMVREYYKENKINEIIYSNIQDEINPESLKAFTKIAYQCLKIDQEERPLMTQVVSMLEKAFEYQISGMYPSRTWKLTEISEPSQCRSLRPDRTPSAVPVSRLMALAANPVLKKNDHSSTPKITVSVIPQLWQPTSGILMTNDISDTNPKDAVPCFALSTNDFYVVSASGGKISLFNMMTFESMTTFMSPPPAATVLAFHPQDDNIIAIGMEDSVIHIYDVRVHEIKTKLKGHHKRITGLAFSNVLNVLVSSGADSQLCVWNTNGWEKQASKLLQIPSGHVMAAPFAGTRVQFHQDQTHLLAVHETQIAVYEAPKLETPKQWFPPKTSGLITHATYSCHSQSIFVVFGDASVGILTSSTLRLRCWINSIAYLPSNPRVHPFVIAAHPSKPDQFALRLSDGGVCVLEPLESEEKWGTSPPTLEDGGAASTTDPAHRLEEESGFYFNMHYFEEMVTNGDLDDVENYLSEFTKVDDNKYSIKIFFEIRKHKYLEALDRKDRSKAVDILVKELKVFSTFNEGVYKEMTQLLTLDNFRENEELSNHGDTKSARGVMLGVLKELIEANPQFHDRLNFPSLMKSRLESSDGDVFLLESPVFSPSSTTPGAASTTDLAQRLAEESVFYFNMRYFEEMVTNGDWDDVENYLSEFTKVDDNRYSMKIFFEIRKQKYLEALDRKDRSKAVDILVNDLKVFSVYNEDLYKEITQLLTLDNFRDNEQLSSYGDTQSSRRVMLIELKKVIEANPMLRDKLNFPILMKSRLGSIPDQFESGLSDGGVCVLEPQELEGKRGTSPPTLEDGGAGPSSTTPGATSTTDQYQT